MTSDIMKFILSGGGVALLAAFGKLAYDWIQGRVMREESAVTQWQGIARSRLDEIHRMKVSVFGLALTVLNFRWSSDYEPCIKNFEKWGLKW